MDLIVLDTETTGVNAREDSLIEIAAARVVDGRITDRFRTFVKPVKTPLNTTVSVLTGIKPEDLVDAPDISEIKPKLLEFVGDLPITGHNISFDLDFLKANGIDPVGHSLDTLDLVITILPKLPYHSMQFLAQYFQLPAQPSHRAMDDVLATTDLLNVLIGYVQQLPSPVLKNVRAVLAKSDWEWSWVFDENSSWQSPSSFRHSGLDPESRQENKQKQILNPCLPARQANLAFGQSVSTVAKRLWRTLQDDGKETILGEIKIGFNLYELPPNTLQIPANIALASEDKTGILVVSNAAFNQTDWSLTQLTQQFGASVQLAADRLDFLLTKPQLKSTEVRLLIKVFLTGYPATPFNPNGLYLTKDEYYLWEQKLAPFRYTVDKLPDRAVMNFSTLWEMLEHNPDLLKERTIYLPQWLEFTDWTLFKSVRIFTALYLHAAVASRRDYVHDFITDNKVGDDMFKLLNNFGTQINNLWAAVEQLWQIAGGDKTSLINDWLTTQKSGKEVAQYADQAAATLEKFLEKVKSAPTNNTEANARQIEHTQKLLEYLQALSGKTEYKIYLEGYLDRVTLYIVKFPIANVWQELKEAKVVVASNNLLVSGAGDFMTNVFGESVAVSGLAPAFAGQAGQQVSSSPAKGRVGGDDETVDTRDDAGKKPITIVKTLPDRKSPDYEDKVFDYLRQNLRPDEKVMVVFSNNAQVGIFFEKYYQKISGVDLISYNVAGNSEILESKLSAKPNFALLVSNSNLFKYAKSVNCLQRVIFLTLPFDPPGTLGQVLATTKLKNDFTDYSLPRATLKFKQSLAELHDKTSEFWILDSRLINADWASPILSSLTGFSVREV